MTNEEARLALQDNFGYLSNEHPRIVEALKVALEVLSKPELPSNLDEAAIKRMRESDMYLSDATIAEIGDVLLKMAHFGAEWMAGQFQKIEGDLVDWYSTSDGKEYCCGIMAIDPFEVPEGFYIRKK